MGTTQISGSGSIIIIQISFDLLSVLLCEYCLIKNQKLLLLIFAYEADGQPFNPRLENLSICYLFTLNIICVPSEQAER